MAERLQWQLRRLEAMQEAGARLMARAARQGHLRPRPARGGRGAPSVWDVKLYDLLAAYARERQKHALSRVTVHRRIVWSIAEAREALQRLAGVAVDWTVLDDSSDGLRGRARDEAHDPQPPHSRPCSKWCGKA